MMMPNAGRRGALQRARLAGLRLAGRCYAGGGGAARSILLIRPDHLGDVLFLTPALHALRAALPAARLTLLAGPWGADAVRGNPDLDDLRLCRFPGFERGPKAGRLAPYRLLAATAAEIRAGGYDTAVVLRFDHWWGAWLAAAAGIPRRIGYAWPETQPFLTEAIPYQPGRHEVEQNCALLEALAPGAGQQPGPLRYAIDPAGRDWAAAWLTAQGLDPARPLVAIHPGAGAAVKQWPVPAWAAVADGLASAYAVQFVLTGGPAERPLAQGLAAAMHSPAFDASGQTNLAQLAALYSRCALVLGSDSGPLHLAVAAGAPTVQLYGPVPPRKFGPWGDPARQRVVATPWACAPCDRLAWPERQLPLHGCVAAITPARVLAVALEILQANGQSKEI